MVDTSQMAPIALESAEGRGVFLMYRRQRLLQQCTDCLWRVAPDHRGQDGRRALFNPHGKLANLEGFRPLFRGDAKGILHKILNSRQHAGDQVWIAYGGGICGGMQYE